MVFSWKCVDIAGTRPFGWRNHTDLAYEFCHKQRVVHPSDTSHLSPKRSSGFSNTDNLTGPKYLKGEEKSVRRAVGEIYSSEPDMTNENRGLRIEFLFCSD